MSRRWQLALLALGALLFTLVVRRIGAGEIVANAIAVGWYFVPILALYGVAYACNTAAWRLAMPRGYERPSFWRTYAITVSGFSLNFVTPMVNAGGEPFRAAAVVPWFGRRKATSTVILHRMLHTLALLLTWLTALVLALVLLPRSAPVVGTLLAATAVVALLAWLLVRGHRHGVLEGALDLLHRMPLVRRVAARFEPRREMLADMDRQIAEFYHASPVAFFAALALEYTARGLYMVEYWLICLAVGIPVTYAKAYLIGGLSSLALNALFFIPFELGSKEGTLYVLFSLVGLDPSAGVYTAIVSRARDMLWIAAGLTLLAVVRHERRPRVPVPATPPGVAG
ncbi:MAG TPA: lysylphosphatidylglycerol synthase transmembrane domain-containing protein [Gemmatimonadales bacterium]|nr:lysylphosphatidylglycerol synthase transmembrane domain-containing protein [Gemmatimonadales bacterium]